MFHYLKEKVSYFYRHPFIRNVAVFQAGSFAGNFIQALVGVFLARILQPEGYGIYSLAFGLASLVALFLSGGVQEAASTQLGLAYARQDKNAIREILAFLLKMVIITGIIVLLFSAFLPAIARHFYKNGVIGLYAVIIVAASLISTSFFSISSLALQVVGKIKTMTLLGLADQTLRSLSSLFLVLLGFGILGASIGHFIGAVIIFVISALVWEMARKESLLLPALRDVVSHVREVSLRKYLGFSLWIALDKNIASLYGSLPMLLVGIFVTTGQVTFFKLAFGYINLALSLLGPVSTLLNIEFPKLQVADSRNLGRHFLKVSLYGVGLSTVLTLGAIIVSPIAFRVLYGTKFLPSLKYVSEFLIYGVLFGIGVGLGPMWRAVNKVKLSIVINVTTLGLGVPLGMLLIGKFGLSGAVIMVTLWYTVSHLISFLYLLSAFKSAKMPFSNA